MYYRMSFIGENEKESVKTHEDGIVNLYSEIKKQNEKIEQLSLQVVKMKVNNTLVHEAFSGLTEEESKILADKMNLHSKVIKTQRHMNERSS